MQGSISQLDPADVGDVLALGELAIDVRTRERFVFRILLHDCLGTLFELGRRFGGPPITKISDGVELPALVIEAMSHFVSDDGANPAVINCVVGIGVEERRLQNSSRENDLIHVRVVIRVHRRRCHAPFGAIDRFADLLKLAVDLEIFSADRVEDEWTPIDLKQRIIAPFVGVTDLDCKSGVSSAA